MSTPSDAVHALVNDHHPTPGPRDEEKMFNPAITGGNRERSLGSPSLARISSKSHANRGFSDSHSVNTLRASRRRKLIWDSMRDRTSARWSGMGSPQKVNCFSNIGGGMAYLTTAGLVSG